MRCILTLWFTRINYLHVNCPIVYIRRMASVSVDCQLLYKELVLILIQSIHSIHPHNDPARTCLWFQLHDAYAFRAAGTKEVQTSHGGSVAASQLYPDGHQGHQLSCPQSRNCQAVSWSQSVDFSIFKFYFFLSAKESQEIQMFRANR